MDIDRLAEIAYAEYKYLASGPNWVDLSKADQAGWRVAVDAAAEMRSRDDTPRVAQAIYGEYRETVPDWDSTERTMPEWDELTADERQGWMAAVPVIVENAPYL